MIKIKDNYKIAAFFTLFPSILMFILKSKDILPEWYNLFAFPLYVCALSAIALPDFGILLHKLSKKAGAFIGNYISHVILFFIWIITVFPTGMLMKIAKRDRLKIKKRDCNTYWIDNKAESTDYEYQF